ncbi:MAG: glycosyltransferase family 2 protein [Planctomycetota bacterium]
MSDQDNTSSSQSKTHPFLSVIVPVYNDNKGLAILLESLTQQTYPRDRFEVIIVDNGSSEDVKAVTDQYPDKFKVLMPPAIKASIMPKEQSLFSLIQIVGRQTIG